MSSQKDGFELVRTFVSHKEVNDYLKAKMTFTIEKSSLINCSICRSRNHKMRYKIGRCNDESCNRQVKILFCQKREHGAYFIKGQQNAEHKERRPNYHGLTKTVKEKIEELIFTYDSRPKRLHIKSDKLKRKNKIENDHMPTLKQVQDYINNRRRMYGI